jgi:hypothetical protein
VGLVSKWDIPTFSHFPPYCSTAIEFVKSSLSAFAPQSPLALHSVLGLLLVLPASFYLSKSNRLPAISCKLQSICSLNCISPMCCDETRNINFALKQSHQPLPPSLMKSPSVQSRPSHNQGPAHPTSLYGEYLPYSIL